MEYKADESLATQIIEHHGVKGMQWGVRRSTESSSKGSGRSGGLFKKKPKAVSRVITNPKTDLSPKQLSRVSKAREHAWNKTYKKRGTMSDAELRSAVNRLQMEAQMKTLVSQVNKGNTSSGKKFVNAFKDKAITALAEGSAQRLVNKALDKAIK